MLKLISGATAILLRAQEEQVELGLGNFKTNDTSWGFQNKFGATMVKLDTTA